MKSILRQQIPAITHRCTMTQSKGYCLSPLSFIKLWVRPSKWRPWRILGIAITFNPLDGGPLLRSKEGRLILLQGTHAALGFYNVPPHSDIRQVAIKADYVLCQQSKFVSQYCTCHILTVCLDDPITSKKR